MTPRGVLLAEAGSEHLKVGDTVAKRRGVGVEERLGTVVAVEGDGSVVEVSWGGDGQRHAAARLAKLKPNGVLWHQGDWARWSAVGLLKGHQFSLVLTDEGRGKTYRLRHFPPAGGKGQEFPTEYKDADTAKKAAEKLIPKLMRGR